MRVGDKETSEHYQEGLFGRIGKLFEAAKAFRIERIAGSNESMEWIAYQESMGQFPRAFPKIAGLLQ